MLIFLIFKLHLLINYFNFLAILIVSYSRLLHTAYIFTYLCTAYKYLKEDRNFFKRKNKKIFLVMRYMYIFFVEKST